MAEDRMRGSSD